MMVISAHQEALSKEAHEQLALMAPMYADIIFEQSSFTQPGLQFRPHRNDNLFFEALYTVELPYACPSEHLFSGALKIWAVLNRGLV